MTGWSKGTPNNDRLLIRKIVDTTDIHIFPKFDKIVVERDEKFGGDLEYESFEELVKDFVSGELHPLDLKKSVANF